MRSASLLLLLRKELRDRYPTGFALFGETFGLLASLTIYGFTSRAFSTQGALAPAELGGALGGAKDYFEFLVIGETALFLPLALFQGIARSFRQSVANGTWEAMLCQPVRPVALVVLLGGALVPLELARVVATLVCASLLWGLTFQGNAAFSISAALLLQLAALPAFLGLGMGVVGVLCRFGRGDSFLSYVGAGASILAGAYFPVSVLPPALRTATENASPFTVLLEATRAAMAGNFATLPVSFGLLLLWGAACLTLGVFLLRIGVRHAQARGSSILLSS